MLKLELEVENDICRPYFPMQQLYEYCIQNHKKIYIVSDMYLPACSIERILNKNGYAGYCRIYSSCDYRVTKWENGDLFQRIVNDENLQKKDILHIGNDKVADFKMAQNQGIDAYLIDEPTIQCRYSSRNHSFGYQCMENLSMIPYKTQMTSCISWGMKCLVLFYMDTLVGYMISVICCKYRNFFLFTRWLSVKESF